MSSPTTLRLNVPQRPRLIVHKFGGSFCLLTQNFFFAFLNYLCVQQLVRHTKFTRHDVLLSCSTIFVETLFLQHFVFIMYHANCSSTISVRYGFASLLESKEWLKIMVNCPHIYKEVHLQKADILIQLEIISSILMKSILTSKYY